MKKQLIAAFTAVLATCVFAGPKISILGDSYSTYPGAVPKGNALWYDGRKNGVDSVEKTWWAIAMTYPKAKVYFILNDGLKVEINDWVHECCRAGNVPPSRATPRAPETSSSTTISSAANARGRWR